MTSLNTQQWALPDICAHLRCSAAGPAHLVWWLVNNAPKFPALNHIGLTTHG